MPAAYSTQRAVSDGTLMLLPLTIKIMKQADVSVVGANPDGSVAVLPAWSFVGPTVNTIQFVSAVPTGIQVIVKRTTQSANMINVFTAGAAFTNIAMDTDFTQLLYLTQEAVEGAALSDVFNDVDFHGHKLINLGTATNPNDAVSLGQYQADANGAYASRVAAASSAAAASGSQTAAASSATSSANSATASAGSAAAAATSATNSANSATASNNSAGNSATSATLAQAWAVQMGTPVGGIDYSAKYYAGQSATSAGAAATTLTDFATRYLGAKAADPTVDNTGQPLIQGALYYNTTNVEMRLWTGTIWRAAYVADSGFVLRNGDTMTGFLNVNLPLSNTNAANKLYVDNVAAPALTRPLANNANLNNSQFTVDGVWFRVSDTAGGVNFPVDVSGCLEVRSLGAGSMVLQRYSTYTVSGDTSSAGNKVWNRTFYNGTWQPWRQMLTFGSANDGNATVYSAINQPDGYANQWQFRENGLQLSAAAYGPRCAFHWGGVAASMIGIDRNGSFQFLVGAANAYAKILPKSVSFNGGFSNDVDPAALDAYWEATPNPVSGTSGITVVNNSTPFATRVGRLQHFNIFVKVSNVSGSTIPEVAIALSGLPAAAGYGFAQVHYTSPDLGTPKICYIDSGSATIRWYQSFLSTATADVMISGFYHLPT